MTRLLMYPLMSNGRLANSLWQLAATVGLARRHKMQPAFPSNWVYRPFFSCPDEWFRDDLKGAVRAETLAKGLSPKARPYLQDLRLWAHCVDEIRAAFRPSYGARTVIEREWKANFAHLTEPICGVHVRRGDTVTRNPPDSINPLPVDYFLKGVDATGASSAVVFTDDQEWCREHLASHVDILYEGTPGPEDYEPDYMSRPRMDWLDLFALAWCDAVVISNSSYGWWGAYLGNTNNVVVPSRWYGKKMTPHFDVSLILPPQWKRIEVVE